MQEVTNADRIALGYLVVCLQQPGRGGALIITEDGQQQVHTGGDLMKACGVAQNSCCRAEWWPGCLVQACCPLGCNDDAAATVHWAAFMRFCQCEVRLIFASQQRILMHADLRASARLAGWLARDLLLNDITGL